MSFCIQEFVVPVYNGKDRATPTMTTLKSLQNIGILLHVKIW